MKTNYLLFFSLIAIGVLACTETHNDSRQDAYSEFASSHKKQRGKLIHHEFVKTIEAEKINELFPELHKNEGDISSLPNYDIHLYRITYTSVFLYEIIKLSGLIVVPEKAGKLSHLQYHHGTLLPYPYGNGEGSLDAPSLYDGGYPKTEFAQYESRLFGNYLGSHGYLVSLPDYAGYGVSDSLEHPFSVNKRLAEQSVDMILATQQFCREQGIDLDEKLFLSGWSEGAAASVATQKLIESEYDEQLEVTANAPLAGFYTLKFYGFLKLNFLPWLPLDWGEDLDVLAWTIYAINRYTDEFPVESDEVFKIDVNNQMDVLKNRSTGNPFKVLKQFSSKRSDLISKYAQNDLSDDWVPQAPIYIHHGVIDDIVYFPFNAPTIVSNLNRLGGDVTLVEYKGHDHYSLDKLYLLDMVETFETY